MDEQERDPEPPSPRRVAERAVVLQCVVARSFIEERAEEEWAPRAAQRARDIVDELRLWHEVEDGERAVLDTPLGKLDDRRSRDASWRVEGLAVLCWALGLLELPPYDAEADTDLVQEALDMSDGDAPVALFERAALRPHDEIDDLDETYFAAHWRLREFARTPEILEFQEFARTAWFGPLRLDGLRLVDGDLAIRGASIALADEAERRTVNSILTERRTATGWLLGGDEIYSEIVLNT